MQTLCCCSSRRRARSVDLGAHGDAASSSISCHERRGWSRKPINWTGRQPSQSSGPCQPRGSSHDARADDGRRADGTGGSLLTRRISPQDGAIELCQLVDEGLDFDDQDNDSLSAKPSTGTLDVVRTKLIKHLPQDGETKRQARTAIGHSEEELARRAELRRIRQKRIQEELEKEGANDNSSNRSHLSTRYLSPLIDPGHPGNGPRDTIEFSVDGGVAVPEPRPDGGRNGYLDRSKHSRACSATSPRADISNQVQENEPTHTVPSRRLTDGTRHSVGVETVHGAEGASDVRASSHIWDDHSALGIWLVAQEMRSRDSSPVRAVDGTCEAARGFDAVPLPAQNLVATEATTAETTTQDKTPSRQEGGAVVAASSSLVHQDGANKGSSTPTILAVSLPSSKTSSESHASASTVKVPIDNTSSNYPSVLPSFQPSPADSTINNFSLSPEDIETLELSPFKWYGDLSMIRDFGRSEGCSSYATAEDDTQTQDALCNSVAPLSPVQTLRAASSPQQTQPRSVGRRSNETLSLRQASTPVHSRFTEDFANAATTLAPGRVSLVNKIQSSIVRFSKAASYGLGPNESRYNDDAVAPQFQVPCNPASFAAREPRFQQAAGPSNRSESRTSCLDGSSIDLTPSGDSVVIESLEQLRQGFSHLWTNNKQRDASDGSAAISTAVSKRTTRGLITLPEPRALSGTLPSSDGPFSQHVGLAELSESRAHSRADNNGAKAQGCELKEVWTSPEIHARPSTRLEKAVRTGLDKLLPLRRASQLGRTSSLRRGNRPASSSEKPLCEQGNNNGARWWLKTRIQQVDNGKRVLDDSAGRHGRFWVGSTGATRHMTARPLTCPRPLSRVRGGSIREICTLDGAIDDSASGSTVRRWKSTSGGRGARVRRSITWSGRSSDKQCSNGVS